MRELPPGAALHPWNRGFAWRGPASRLRALTPAQAEQFDRDGYVVLDGALAKRDVADVVAEIDAFDAQTEAFLRTQPESRFMILESGAITFSIHLVARSALLRRFASAPLFADLCHDLVGDDVHLYWDQAVYKKPEKPRRFPWHQDNGYAYVEPQQYLTCWIALTDATEENGCPWIAPGVHRFGTLRHRYVEPLGFECFADPPKRVAAPVAAGGVVVFSSLTPHLTGPNATPDVRKAYIVQYAPAGARKLVGDPDAGPPASTEACEHPDRQYPVLQGGAPVTTPETPARA
ncbi:MAG TPA: phytanoyl-CoA dioxygenase family protein [Candidatus Binatia bacterium]|nr:phytanoyl-CoA dioxygenase family protein [Candidatus Binatia bacterium]